MPIPTARLKDRIAQLDEEYSIFFIKTQKSYTSIASFLDGAIYLLMARNPTRFGKGSPIVISKNIDFHSIEVKSSIRIMIITHCYKIKLTCEHSAKIDYWHLAAKEALELCTLSKFGLF